MPRSGAPYWLAAALAGLGLGTSGYLAYADFAGTVVACGGLGDCEAAHASAYAYVYGLPVSYLGFGAFACLALAIAWSRVGAGPTRLAALLGSLSVAVGGAVFSGYLTYVEFFVIHAICPWCVASAAAVTTLTIVLAIVVRREMALS